MTILKKTPEPAPIGAGPGSDAARPAHAGTASASSSTSTRSHDLVVAPSSTTAAPGGTLIKHFVLDTNVLLHNPNALFVFQENAVIIPYRVIEELDTMKRRDDEIGRNARACIRHLDRLRTHGKLTEGVGWDKIDLGPSVAKSIGPDGQCGTVRVDVEAHPRPPMIAADAPDNHIIACAYALKQQGLPAYFVSKDLSARIKSDTLGIPTQDFENQKVDADRLYTGSMDVDVPTELIDRLYRDRAVALTDFEPFLTETLSNGETHVRTISSNQYLVLHDVEDEAHSGLGRRLADTDHVIPVGSLKKPVFGIMSRNVQQTMALDLLLDDEVRLVTLLGQAGTGKTLLAIAAAMHKVFNEDRYDKLLVARPIMPMGRDIGYLPGTKDEKLEVWMQPVFDNLSYLLSTRGSGDQHADSKSADQRIAKYMADGQLVLEPLTYIRGRSIPKQFMIVDEAQNLTPHEVKTIASRVGEGTKLVLTGDIEQIDNPYLDQSSNGLSYLVERLRGAGMVGHVTLKRSERSDLASLAASRL